MRVTALGAILLLFVAVSPAYGARPLVTEDTETVEKGSFELELAFDYSRDDNRDQYYIPSLQFKYGLTQQAEIGASMAYLFKDIHEAEPIDGWGDLITYVKYRLWEEGTYFPSFALKPLVKFSTANWKKGLGSGKTDYGLGAILSKSFGDFSFHWDNLYLFLGEKAQSDVLHTGLAVEYRITNQLTGVGEIRYSQNFNSAREDDAAFVVWGLKRQAGKAIFDVGMSLGLNSAAPDYGLTLGVTIPFP